MRFVVSQRSDICGKLIHQQWCSMRGHAISAEQAFLSAAFRDVRVCVCAYKV